MYKLFAAISTGKFTMPTDLPPLLQDLLRGEEPFNVYMYMCGARSSEYMYMYMYIYICTCTWKTWARQMVNKPSDFFQGELSSGAQPLGHTTAPTPRYIFVHGQTHRQLYTNVYKHHASSQTFTVYMYIIYNVHEHVCGAHSRLQLVHKCHTCVG